MQQYLPLPAFFIDIHGFCLAGWLAGWLVGWLAQDVEIPLSDFNISGGCFGTDIIPKCTKWSQIGVHGLIIGQIFAKFKCASFLIRKNVDA